MKKKPIVIVVVFVVFCIICSIAANDTSYNSIDNKEAKSQTALKGNSNNIEIESKITKITDIPSEKIGEIKDEITRKSSLSYKNCGGEFEGECIDKSSYRYYVQTKVKDGEPAKTERVITGYCTLCNDGQYSPSNAKGRGACSHHGGVANWNAPVYDTNYIPATNPEYKKEEIKMEDTEVYKLKYNTITDTEVINYYNLHK